MTTWGISKREEVIVSVAYILLLLFCVVLLVVSTSCSRVTGRAGPDGKLTEVSYWQFMRSYDLHIKQEEKGLEVQVGAESETQKLKDLLEVIGPLIGAASAAKLGGIVP